MSRSLQDDEIKCLVERLEGEVRKSKGELSSLSQELETLQDTIHAKQVDRQHFNEKLFKVEEVELLVTDTKQVKQELSLKKRHLELLKQGTADEQREVESLVLKLEKLEVDRTLDRENSKTETTVEHLKQEFDQKSKLHVSMKAKLEKVQKELRLLHSKTHPHQHHKGMDKELDKFILKSCKKAGLKLVQN